MRDAQTAIGIADAVVAGRRQRVRTLPDGRFSIVAAGCDTLHVRRLGYRGASHVLLAEGPVVIAMQRAAVPLPAVEARAAAGSQGRTVVTGDAAEARILGGSSAGDLAATLPFVGVRMVSGRTALSVRGSRPEQVLVTLDGIPLNDPATGTADLADIPLAALGGVSVAFGTSGAVHGSGATGGVMALHSGTGTIVAGQVGAYGNRAVEGAWTNAGAAGRIRIGGAFATGDDDFSFRNVAAAAPADTVERRRNNDFQRASGFLTAAASRWQLLVLHGETERGLVGPMNVRAFDGDRGRTARSVARVATTAGPVDLHASARHVAARYDGGAGAHPAFRVRARSLGVAAAMPVAWLALESGASIDRVDGSTLARSSRSAAFAGAHAVRDLGRLRASGALRLDVVERSMGRLSPSLVVERPGAVTLAARVGQGFRVPTFYDIYFASPQRITVQPLVPERVALDAEVRASADAGCGGVCSVQAAVSLFERRTHDAIVWFPGNVGWSPQNVPEERARGGEVQVAMRRPGVTAKAWGGSYHTMLWDGFLEMRTPYVPYWAGGGVINSDGEHLSTRIQVTYTGRRPFVTGPAIAELELPQVTVVALGIQRHQATERGLLTITLSVDDLLDVRPEFVRRYPTAGRRWTAGLSLSPRRP
ncbi:MAG: TonB-dependent receptor [Gemmatimonadaceae bacterium]|nr:TonB-dependent receptor [Gemmatimonadaceae bacterium]